MEAVGSPLPLLNRRCRCCLNYTTRRGVHRTKRLHRASCPGRKLVHQMSQGWEPHDMLGACVAIAMGRLWCRLLPWIPYPKLDFFRSRDGNST